MHSMQLKLSKPTKFYSLVQWLSQDNFIVARGWISDWYFMWLCYSWTTKLCSLFIDLRIVIFRWEIMWYSTACMKRHTIPGKLLKIDALQWYLRLFYIQISAVAILYLGLSLLCSKICPLCFWAFPLLCLLLWCLYIMLLYCPVHKVY